VYSNIHFMLSLASTLSPPGIIHSISMVTTARHSIDLSSQVRGKPTQSSEEKATGQISGGIEKYATMKGDPTISGHR
jgi:hypothetical protein